MFPKRNKYAIELRNFLYFGFQKCYTFIVDGRRGDAAISEDRMKDHESEEMYLETILLLKGRKAAVRSIDVAESLGYAKSSVSRAVNLLQDRGYIVIDADGFIGFTDEGERRAERIYDRHLTLTRFFSELGASDAAAERNACRIEHVIDDEIFELIKARLGK